VKFCQFVANLYPHMHTSFGQFILIFHKMTLNFLEILIIITIESLQFQH